MGIEPRPELYKNPTLTNELPLLIKYPHSISRVRILSANLFDVIIELAYSISGNPTIILSILSLGKTALQIRGMRCPSYPLYSHIFSSNELILIVMVLVLSLVFTFSIVRVNVYHCQYIFQNFFSNRNKMAYFVPLSVDCPTRLTCHKLVQAGISRELVLKRNKGASYLYQPAAGMLSKNPQSSMALIISFCSVALLLPNTPADFMIDNKKSPVLLHVLTLPAKHHFQ